MADVIAQPLSGRRAMRPRDEIPDHLPLLLRTAVHSVISQGRFRAPWSNRIVLIKWVITGEAAIRINGRRIPFGPGDVAIYLPTLPHEFWATSEETDMCWFSVEGPAMEEFVHALKLRPGVFPYGEPPVAQIDEMIDSLDDSTLAGYQRSSLLAIRLLYDIASRIPAPPLTSVVRQVQHLIREGLADPELSVNEIAEKIHYNRGSLSRMFHKQTGMTILDCITQTRLQEAEMLLHNTEERISDIARKCGFRDDSYFTRWIKRHTGRLPSQIRKTAGDGV